MKLLLDTQLLLRAASQPDMMSATALRMIRDPANDLHFSTASLWEIAMKATLGRADYLVDGRRLRRGLLDNGYEEVPVTADHAFALTALPGRAHDPFDLMLIGQAMVEGLTLLTSDPALMGYPGPIRHV